MNQAPPQKPSQTPVPPADDSQDSLLKFPCPITVKAFGKQTLENEERHLRDIVLEIIHQHCPAIPDEHIGVKLSAKGNYVSINVRVTAESREHIDAIYQALSDCEHVTMAL